VKGNGYGHGAALAARACLDAGATWLGVSAVSEGLALREYTPEAAEVLAGQTYSVSPDEEVVVVEEIEVEVEAAAEGEPEAKSETEGTA